jgi:hypothetical protein
MEMPVPLSQTGVGEREVITPLPIQTIFRSVILDNSFQSIQSFKPLAKKILPVNSL